MARWNLWELENALGLDVDDLGQLDEICRSLKARLRSVIEESVELIRLRRKVDLTSFMTTMTEGGFTEGSAWSHLDDIEDAAGIPEIEDLFDLLSVLMQARGETFRVDELTYLADRTGINSVEELFPLTQTQTDVPAHRNQKPAQFKNSMPIGATTTVTPNETPPDIETIDIPILATSEPVVTQEPYSGNLALPGASSVKFLHRFPNLILLSKLPIESWSVFPADVTPFSVRISNSLRRRGIERWDQLLELSESEFASFPNVGVTSIEGLVEVLTTLHSYLLEGLPFEESDIPTSEIQSPAVLVARAFSNEQIHALLTIRKWASLSGEGRGLGPILSGADRAPADVLEAVAVFRDSPLEGSSRPADVVQNQADALFGALNDREQSILRSRFLSLEPKTFAELGEIFGVSRERVRQLEEVAFTTIDATIETELFDELRWTSWRVAKSLGSKALLTSALTIQIIDAICDLHPSDFAFDIIRLINRTTIKNGWLITGATPEILATFVRCAPEGFLSLENFDSMLTDLGIEALFRDEIIESEQHLTVRLGHVIRKNMAVQDKAYAILSIVNEPRTIDQILELLDESYSTGSARNQLSDDARFTRTRAHEWALSNWDVTPYTNIADSISQEIENRGGAASLSEITPLIAESTGVAPSSVRAYATAPMFELSGDMVRARPLDKPLVVVPNLERTQNAYMAGESTLHLEIGIDSELLRGSGRQANRGLTATLGVQPGGSREFTHTNGVVRVTWPTTGFLGGTIGSLRRLVLEAGGAEGDQVLVTFDLSTSSIRAELLRPPNLIEG
jgi:hypothetical protein